jgi:REP element-mobilizing transposase RayT
MRFPRIKAQGQGFYHVISRIVAGVFVFGTAGLRRVASEKFRSMMGRQAAFSGVQILDYSLMSNHFHLICFVPEARPLSVDEVLERIGAKIKISDPSLIEAADSVEGSRRFHIDETSDLSPPK